MKNQTEKKDKKQSDLVTKESLFAVCALFSAFALFILCTHSLVFGEIGAAVHSLLTGVFGYLAYPAFLGGLYLSVTGLIGKRYVANRKAGWCIGLCAVCAALILHTAFTFAWEPETYLLQCFESGKTFPATTVAGWLGGVVVFIVSTLTTKIGALVVFSALTLFFAYLSYVSLKGGAKAPVKKDSAQPVEIPLTPSQPIVDEPVQYAQPQTPSVSAQAEVVQRPAVSLSEEVAPATAETEKVGGFSPFGNVDQLRPNKPNTSFGVNQREFLFSGTPAENYRNNLIFDPNASVNKRTLSSTPTPVVSEGYSSYTDAYQNSVNDGVARPQMVVSDRVEEETELDYGYEEVQDEPEQIEPLEPISVAPIATEQESNEPSYLQEQEPETEEVRTTQEPAREELNYRDLFSSNNPNVFGSDEENRRFARETFTESGEEPEIEEEPRRGINRFDETEEDDPYTLRGENVRETSVVEEEPVRGRMGFAEPEEKTEDRFSSRGVDAFEPTPARNVEITPPEPKPEPAPPRPRVIRPYKRVPIDDFDCRDVEPTADAEEVEQTKADILATLEDFKVTGASIASVTFGPTVTRYNVTIPRSISPRKIVALDQSIAISLHSSGVNIYPNYEDGVVSIEVPNKERQFVQLGCMLSGDTFVNSKPSSLMFAMGKDVANRKVYGDISKMTHLLVAGSSGSGKSVFLGSLIISLIYKYSPEELRLILIDPKKTEFVLYNNLPHLMINEIITDVNKSIQTLNWAIGEMNRRYTLFEKMSFSGTYVVNLDEYNAQLPKNERLPKIVIIIDELADLMLAAKKDIEDRIQNLTQKARAAGIHLVVATQRPSIDVITGVIKSNLATRIAFAVATDVDSRVILDRTGAQKLLGKGDFLYTMQGLNSPVRVQSAFISSEDSQRVVNYIKANNEAYYDEAATSFINKTESSDGSYGDRSAEPVEPVFIEALRYVILCNSASISMIQRKYSVGYNKAGKIIEWMEFMGYISSFDGAKARKVTITKEEFESKYGPL